MHDWMGVLHCPYYIFLFLVMLTQICTRLSTGSPAVVHLLHCLENESLRRSTGSFKNFENVSGHYALIALSAHKVSFGGRRAGCNPHQADVLVSAGSKRYGM